jgi:hypothetical protein
VWQILVPLFIDTCVASAGYQVTWEDYNSRQKDSGCYVLDKDVKDLWVRDTFCEAPLWVEFDGNNIRTAYRLRLESKNSCSIENNTNGPTFFTIQFNTFKYLITPEAIAEWEEARDRNRYVIIGFDEDFVVKKLAGTKSLLGFPRPSRRQFICPEYATKARPLFADSAALRIILDSVYKMDCCNPNPSSTDCIPFSSFHWKCDEKAVKLTKYLETLPYRYALIKIEAPCKDNSIRGYVPMIAQHLTWDHHTVAAIEFGRLDEFYVLDPTTVENSQNLDSCKLENWKNYFTIVEYSPCPDKKIKTTFYYPPWFCNDPDDHISIPEPEVDVAMDCGIRSIKHNHICDCVREKLDYLQTNRKN